MQAGRKNESEKSDDLCLRTLLRSAHSRHETLRTTSMDAAPGAPDRCRPSASSAHPKTQRISIEDVTAATSIKHGAKRQLQTPALKCQAKPGRSLERVRNPCRALQILPDHNMSETGSVIGDPLPHPLKRGGARADCGHAAATRNAAPIFQLDLEMQSERTGRSERDCAFEGLWP